MQNKISQFQTQEDNISLLEMINSNKLVTNPESSIIHGSYITINVMTTHIELSIGRGEDQIKGGIEKNMEIPKENQSPLAKSFLTSIDIEFRKLVKEEAKNAVSLDEVRKILSKVDRSLSEMVIEERKKERW